MGKVKAAKANAGKKESKKAAPVGVKEGRVTKPTQTSKAKSKDIAKSVATNHAREDDKKKKKSKKPPTPEPEPESESSASESESESESDASSSEEEKVEVKATAKANGVKKITAKADSDSDSSSDSSDSSEDDSESEEEAAPKTKTNGVKANGAVKPTATKASSSSSNSESESESNSDSSEDEAEEKLATKAVTSSDEDSDEDASSSGSDSDSDSESDEEEAPSKKRKAEEAAEPAVKKTKTETETDDNGIKNLFVGNLSWSVDEEWLQREFEEFGEITGVRIITDRETGRAKGFGYVEFATASAAKAAQAAKHGYELDGRAMNVDFSTPRQNNNNKEDRAKKYGDKRSAPSSTLFVGNIAFSASNDTFTELFSEYGTINRISLPTDRETGAPKGFGYVEFNSVDEAKAALESCNGTEVEGRAIRLDFASQRDNNGGGGRGGGFGGRGGGRGGFGGRGGGRGGGGFGGRGGRGGGRGGSTNRGGFSDFKGQKVTF